MSLVQTDTGPTQAQINKVGAAGFLMQGLGALQSAIGTYYSALNNKRNLQYQAFTSELNAKYAEQQAQAIQVAGTRAKQNRQLATAALKSKQRTGLAANGIDLSSNTAARILSTTDLMGEVDALTIDQNTLEAKWSAKRQATGYRGEGAMASASASGIDAAGSAMTSLLGSAGSVASSWYNWKKQR
ncbi:hypothetical protein UFOVP1077_17 [uncultured Caudovirales phage]|uniref:Uncharacterized protein n=1 Tax=uncultured Caudovirales phage TaxID=2100421 RepID=A0A6J5QEH1_9CAUD|nr:hypothetical protein UFOVP1077_17 [uncultured Caudovirales phage]CAB4197309.1 hypothetical protein UFOVP1316_5 [uncultured Caudovirales phage]CAB4211355.1 hypothetical protein UFOVP1428_14 [uncultured Caudovirales phage]CAB5227320.1 hypothetical protein UFOVP1526_30 [uncultured Caudovirales phage]